MAGLCRKGAACPFSHEFAQVQEREELLVPLPAGTKTAAETCEDLPINLDGVRCTFGPGLGLKEVLTGPQGRVSNITIGGLEHRVTDSALLRRLLPTEEDVSSEGITSGCCFITAEKGRRNEG